jgi:hypothetical protein
MKHRRSTWAMTLQLGLLLFVWEAHVGRVIANPDLRFDVVTFCCNCTGSMLCQTQFDHLNFPSLNGHYIAMGTDAYRAELLTNGNLLAIYYNSFDADWNTNTTAAQEAATIDQYSTGNFTATGPRPNWVVLNEISSGTWPSSQTYRTWVENVVHALRVTYGYTVILYSPFTNPANNNSDWQALGADAYIAVENYLSGQEIAAQGFSVSWCQGIYQSSIPSYNGLGVPTSRLILGEHFGQTLANTGYGRSGVSSNNWDSAINARSQAALNAAFAGYIGYDWGNDDMGALENEMVHYEDTYAAHPLPTSGALTLPYPAQQPQSQTAPSGATVTFNVFSAGDAPTTYQWSFNGQPLAGSTTSALTLTNIGPTNGGSYAVQLRNAVGPAWSSNALLTVAIPPPLAFEPFADATRNGGTSYAVGSGLIGQTNAQGSAWYQAGPNSALASQPILQSSNLDLPGLAFPAGNSVRFGGGGGMAARLQIFTNGPGTTSGTIYYSFLMKLTNITGLSSSGVFWAGFNNSAGSQPTVPTVLATRVYTRAASGGFNLGLSKASSTASDWQWDSTVHHLNETIFVVGSYTFNSSSTTDDVSSMWINPAASTFGLANPPAATLVASSGGDITSSIIASFLLMDRDSAEPAGGVVDELRIATAWSSVTPPAGPSPTLAIAQTGGNIILSWPTNATGFNLYSSPTISTINAWTMVPSPVSIVSGQYTVTNTLPAGTEYFCLRLP